jgi:hypothetical protein
MSFIPKTLLGEILLLTTSAAALAVDNSMVPLCRVVAVFRKTPRCRSLT